MKSKKAKKAKKATKAKAKSKTKKAAKTIKAKSKKVAATKKAAPKKAKAKPKAATKTATKPAFAKIMTKVSVVGKPVPATTLEVTGGTSVSLPELKGKRVVLYFYPKDATPGCTLEGHEFSKLKEEFSKEGAMVYGVSRDSIRSHENFKEKECYTIDLLSDEKEELCNAFGVIKDKNMYGKMVRGVERSTFIIDEDGIVQKEWRGVSVPGHAEEVLNFVKTMKSSVIS